MRMQAMLFLAAGLAVAADAPKGDLTKQDRDKLQGKWQMTRAGAEFKQGGTDLPNRLELFRAGTLIVDRKTGEPKTIYVPQAATCVTGGIQPGILARALTADGAEVRTWCAGARVGEGADTTAAELQSFVTDVDLAVIGLGN